MQTVLSGDKNLVNSLPHSVSYSCIQKALNISLDYVQLLLNTWFVLQNAK